MLSGGGRARPATRIPGARLQVAQVEAESLCLGTASALLGDPPAPGPTLLPRHEVPGASPAREVPPFRPG